MKLKIRRPVPDDPNDDGLSRGASLIAHGDPVFAVVRLEALFTEVSPEGEELAVVATVVAGEALLDDEDRLAALDLWTRAYGRRTGRQTLGDAIGDGAAFAAFAAGDDVDLEVDLDELDDADTAED